VVDKIQRF